jgi:O6-methylguanine-DNA--protein-cysteine methyltransferase
MGKNGSLCGFAGGLAKKQQLLELEKPNIRATR